MKEYKKIIIDFIKDIKYIIPVIITSILGFGFVVTHYSINWDSLSYDRYFNGQELLAQGRFGAPLLNKIFNIMNFNPFFVDFLAVLFLILAAILFCTLFKKITNDKLNSIVYTIFSCFFISYPLLSEIFTSSPASLNICLSYCLAAIALILSNEYLLSKKNLYLDLSTLILLFIISIYESFAPVYLLGVFVILILKTLYDDNKYKFSKIITDLFKFIAPLFFGLIFELLIAKIISLFLVNPLVNLNAKIITYQSLGIAGGLEYLAESIVIRYIISAFSYLPIAIFLLTTFLAFIMGIILSINKKNKSIFILFIGLILSSISLSFVQGMASPYRTCQTFALFIGFIFMLLSQFILSSKINKFTKNLLIFLICLIIFYQVKDLHKWFYVNYLRYEEEKNTALLICNEIEKEYGEDNAIIMTGERSFSNNINKYLYLSSDSWNVKAYKFSYKLFFDIDLPDNYKIKTSEYNVLNYLDWGIWAFGQPSVENVKFFNFLGYDFRYGTYEMYIKALEKAKDLPEWPKEGSIIKMDDFVLVNL